MDVVLTVPEWMVWLALGLNAWLVGMSSCHLWLLLEERSEARRRWQEAALKQAAMQRQRIIERMRDAAVEGKVP